MAAIMLAIPTDAKEIESNAKMEIIEMSLIVDCVKFVAFIRSNRLFI